jgi:hypothetical protein
MRSLLLIWALLTLAGVLQPLQASFIVGVLRRDALVVPFATYDGKRWQNEWPVPAQAADVPLSLRNVPKDWWGPVSPRETFQLWTLDSPPQTITVRQPDWAPTYCQRQVGLRTDYQPRFRPPPPTTSPYPKDGLAVSPPHPVEPIEIIGPDSPERDDVLEAIHPRFTTLERDGLVTLPRAHAENPRRVPEPPTERELRSMPPMVIDALYAHGTTRRTYYVEGAREYRKKGACTIVVLVRGMVVRESGKFSTEELHLGFSACDRGSATYMLPLGVMSLPTGKYWIAQIASWDGESYRIIDITPGSNAADKKAAEKVTPGGGC